MKRFLLLTILLVSILSFTYADNNHNVRVALVDKLNEYDTFDVLFDDAHEVVMKDKTYCKFQESSLYSVKTINNIYYVTNAAAEKLTDWEIEAGAAYVPLFTKEGVRLLTLVRDDNDTSDLSMQEVQGAGFYQDGVLKFIVNDFNVKIRPQQTSSRIKMFEREYRGGLSVYFNQNFKLIPINELNLEEYLYGVVPREMSSAYELEALKAQAITARTFAVNYIKNDSKDKPYNLFSSTASQAYGGASREKPKTTSAVALTKGLYLTKNGKPIYAFYSADNGGVMVSSGEVWANPYSYLVKKDDPYTKKITRTWSVKYTSADIEQLLAANNIYIGSVKDIKIVGRTDSGRVSAVNVIGESGEHTLKGNTIRKVLGFTKMLSLLFEMEGGSQETYQPTIISGNGEVSSNLTNVNVVTASGTINLPSVQSVITANGIKNVGASRDQTVPQTEFVFKGRGYGHGVGMSQVGANQMAKEGFNFENILKFYYKDVVIKKL